MSQPFTPEPSSAAETQAGILDALPGHIALVDAQGVILAVNESWRRFATGNPLLGPAFGLGCNYLGLCEQVRGEGAAEAAAAARGLRAVLAGETREYALE